MGYLFEFICVFSFLFLINPITSQQFYDKTDCASVAQVPGSNYLCNSIAYPCDTFVLYRSQVNYSNLSSISSLFNLSETQILKVNNASYFKSNELHIGQEILIPITCSCSGLFSQAVVMYNSSKSDTFPMIACTVYEGLLKAQTLAEQNSTFQNRDLENNQVIVPVRCACPDRYDQKKDMKYLVTYPIAESDNSTFIARKFGVSEVDLLAVNNLGILSTIYPQTTLLIPTKGIPVLKFETTTPPISPASSRPVIPLKKLGANKSSKRRNSFIVLGVGVFIALSFLVVAIGLTLSVRKQWYPRNFQPLSARSSKLSGFSPDFLDGMSKLKHSLLNFSLEELRLATTDFSEDSLVSGSVYHGIVGESHFAIEEMGSEVEAHQVIDILTKINHLNIAKLQGFCFGIRPYLVFEFAELGNLREILSNAKLATELTWAKRMQIAFDLAVGLHYIHYCTNPSYVHRNINSKNVLITMDWRAKISGFKLAKTFTCTEEEVEKNSWYESVIVGRNGYLAPEYLYHGLGSPKVDIHAFGVVLLELMSAKEAVMEGYMLKECVGFLADGGIEGSSGCLEKLKGLMDPSLDRDYPLGDALCLALLAKGCVEEDPQHRPNMNDVLKALSRIV